MSMSRPPALGIKGLEDQEMAAREKRDVDATKKAATEILKRLFDAEDWNRLAEYIPKLARRRKHMKEVVIAIVEQVNSYISQTEDVEKSIILIQSLLKAIKKHDYVLVDELRLVTKLMKIKLDRGQKEEAASLMLEHKDIILNYTDNATTETVKIGFILDQVHFCLQRQDYVRAQRLSDKISSTVFDATDDNPSLSEMKNKYYDLMIRYHFHYSNYEKLSQCYEMRYDIPLEKEVPDSEILDNFLVGQNYQGDAQKISLILSEAHECLNQKEYARALSFLTAMKEWVFEGNTKKKYYGLMIRCYRHNKKYEDLCRCYKVLHNIPEVPVEETILAASTVEQEADDIIFLDTEPSKESNKYRRCFVLDVGIATVCSKQHIVKGVQRWYFKYPDHGGGLLTDTYSKMDDYERLGIDIGSKEGGAELQTIFDKLNNQVVVGYNVGADISWINRTLQIYGKGEIWPASRLDILALAETWYDMLPADKRPKKVKLSYMVRHIGLSKQMHQSVQDIYSALDVLKYLLMDMYVRRSMASDEPDKKRKLETIGPAPKPSTSAEAVAKDWKQLVGSHRVAKLKESFSQMLNEALSQPIFEPSD